jgi:hypothetical protein
MLFASFVQLERCANWFKLRATTGDLDETAGRVADKASFSSDAGVSTGHLPELTTFVSDVAGFLPDHGANHPARNASNRRTDPRARRAAGRRAN